ncbi:MAG: hypothetical protein CGU29_11985 [Candidatus Dactylopiibacterium carminicum]|nr:MAG: hypothetical protein CGU29_11985 [Candidatus Dactylopiibacterium carminicum]
MGEPDKAVVEWLHMKEKLHALTTSAIEESGLLSELSMNEEEKGNFSNRIRVDVYNHGDQGAAAVFGFISGLTLGVIPAAATDNYTVKVVLLDREGKELKSSTSKDSVTTWIGLIFIPMAGNTPEIAVTETIKNQIKLGFRDLVDGGTLIAAK